MTRLAHLQAISVLKKERTSPTDANGALIVAIDVAIEALKYRAALEDITELLQDFLNTPDAESSKALHGWYLYHAAELCPHLTPPR